MVKSELVQKLCNMHPNILRRDIEKILDIIIFEGASNNNIKNITFMDAKTGAARLEKNQKQETHSLLNLYLNPLIEMKNYTLNKFNKFTFLLKKNYLKENFK